MKTHSKAGKPLSRRDIRAANIGSNGDFSNPDANFGRGKTPHTPTPASPAHTPEPWQSNPIGKTDRRTITAAHPDGGGQNIVDECLAENAARIVACVNACAGMTDPAQEIAALRARSNNVPAMCAEVEKQRAEIKALRDALEAAIDIMEGREAGSERVDALSQARAALSAFGGEAGK